MGAVMQCLGCRADNNMLLMDVLRDDTMKVPVIEHQIYNKQQAQTGRRNPEPALALL